MRIWICGRSSAVEHNLAKVGVDGSNPFARSIVILFLKKQQSYFLIHLTEASPYGSEVKVYDLRSFIPKSKLDLKYPCPGGGMVDTGDLKSPGHCDRAGSSPAPGTIK